MNPLLTVRGAITTGFVLALVLAILIAPTAFHELGLARWLHILSGITWIGLLYFFNFVQVATAPHRNHSSARGATYLLMPAPPGPPLSAAASASAGTWTTLK